MFVVVIGGSQDFIEECRGVAKNVTVKIVEEGSSIEQVGTLIRKHSPHAVLIPGTWAGEVANLAKINRGTKIFVFGGIEKNRINEWEESGLSIYLVSNKAYKALLDIEAHLKFTSPAKIQFDDSEKVPPDVEVFTGNKGKKSIAIAVWSPSGTLKSFTALNLAIVIKAALLNFDLTCPELDVWFGIRQTGIQGASEKDAGILTMGEYMNPALVPRMLREIKWGIRYLPVGTKIGNIGTPDYGDRADDLFKEIIAVARNDAETVIIDAGRDMEIPATYAALHESDIIIVPMLGSPQEAGVVYWQINELTRVGISKPTLELVFNDKAVNMNKVCKKRIQLNIDLNSYMESSYRAVPYCLLKGEEEWGEILQYVKSLCGKV